MFLGNKLAFFFVKILFPLLLRLFYSWHSRTVQRTALHITLTSRTTNTTARSLTPRMDSTPTTTVQDNIIPLSAGGIGWTRCVRNTTPSVRMRIVQIIL